MKHRRGHSHLLCGRPNEWQKKPVEGNICHGLVGTVEVFGALVSFALNEGLEPLLGVRISQMGTFFLVENPSKVGLVVRTSL